MFQGCLLWIDEQIIHLWLWEYFEGTNIFLHMIGKSPFHLYKQYDFISAHKPPDTCTLINSLPTIPVAERQKLYLEIYDPRASLPPHCRGETELRLSTVLSLGAGIQVGWTVQLGFTPVGVQMQILRFDWAKICSRSHCSSHPGADKNSSSSNAHGVHKDRKACKHTHSQAHNTVC